MFVIELAFLWKFPGSQVASLVLVWLALVLKLLA